MPRSDRNNPDRSASYGVPGHGRLRSGACSGPTKMTSQMLTSKSGAADHTSLPDTAAQTDGMDLLVIEDDRQVCHSIRESWPTPADRLHFVSTYKQSLKVIHSAELGFYDGAVVDVHLPDGDGLTILRTIRANVDLPIVLISSSSTAEMRAEAIDRGADDFVMKPFSVRELQARISRLVAVRRQKAERDARPTFELNEMSCDLQRRVLARNGREVPLTDAEARLLELLEANENQTCSKSQLYKNAFFREYDPADKTLDVYVSRLRKKIGTLDQTAAQCIQTVRGYGYRISKQ